VICVRSDTHFRLAARASVQRPSSETPASDDQQSSRQVPSPLPLLEGERDDGAGGAGPIPTGCWRPSGLHWVQGVRSTRPSRIGSSRPSPAGPRSQRHGQSPYGTIGGESPRQGARPRRPGHRPRVADVLSVQTVSCADDARVSASALEIPRQAAAGRARCEAGSLLGGVALRGLGDFTFLGHP
jgi:hypothetical protein